MAKIRVLNYGCSANLAESEGMQGLLKKAGHEVSDNAEIIVMNLCTVKGDAAALREVREAHEKNPHSKFVLTGCVTNNLREQLKKDFPKDSIMTTHQVSQISDVVNKTIQGETVELKLGKREQKINLPKIRTNPVVGVVAISNGCLSTCTYCSVKHIKGHLSSYSLQAIKKEVEECVKEGCKEIWLTSQDNGCWGFDLGLHPGHLLKAITDIKGDFWVRFGMASPQHVAKYLTEIIEAYKSSKMFKFLHIPVQSGSNKVLQYMKREYTAELYKDLVAKFKKEIPNIRIATDIITGFPTETDKDFEQTIKLIEETQTEVVNVSRFVARPNTPAAKLTQLAGNVAKERTKKMAELCKQVSELQLKKLEGWKGKVLIDEKGKDNTMIARNENYVPIILEGTVGEFCEAEIVKAKEYHCVGKRLN